MVADAHQRADEAEARLSAALERAEESRREAEAHARTLLGNARNNADEIVAEAREHAEKIISEAVTDAERERSLAMREVEELNRQRESITSYLDDLRSLLGQEPATGLAAASKRQAQQEEAEAAAQAEHGADVLEVTQTTYYEAEEDVDSLEVTSTTYREDAAEERNA
jgi:cell division septum initiation protein DivIVA